MPMAGVEPARSCLHQILSLARLPIPSHRHIQLSIIKYLVMELVIINFSAQPYTTHLILCDINRYGQPSHRHIQLSIISIILFNQKKNLISIIIFFTTTQKLINNSIPYFYR